MTATNGKERVSESSRDDFREAERGAGLMGHDWSGSTEGWAGSTPRREAVPSVSDLPFTAWGGWRGGVLGTHVAASRLRQLW